MVLSNVFLYFVIYSFIGWCCESIYVSGGQRKWVNRGFLHSPLCPIYGFGGLIILYILDPFAEHPILIFLLGMFATSILEYITSWLMEKIFHIRWWDYSKQRFNINGRVSLKNSLMFGVLGLILVYFIHPNVRVVIEDIPENIKLIIAAFFAIGIAIDFVISTLNALNIDRTLREIHDILHSIYENGETAIDELNKNIDQMVKKLEKNQIYFQKSFPTFKHLKYQFDKSVLDDFASKLKGKKRK